MKKILLFVAILVLVVFLFNTGLFHQLNFSELKNRHVEFQNLYQDYPWKIPIAYFFFYVFCTAFSIPGAAILSLGAGAIFGVVYGTILVSFASTLGASIAFLLSRYFFRETIQTKFRQELTSINKGIEQEGGFYLFSLRLIPVFPFFLINLLMGLTTMSVWRFAFVGQIGMLLGTVVYVNAGTQLAHLDGPRDILSLPLIISFIVLGLFPLMTNKAIFFLRSKKVYGKFKKPKTFDYNILVVGAGSAGLVTSYIASAVRAKVGLIEKHRMGGECLNTGCVPSKALIKIAKILKTVNSASKFGLRLLPPEIEFSQMMARVQDVIAKIRPHDSIERYTSLGVDCIQGEAEILSPWEIRVNNKILKTKNIVLATGALPIIPDIPGLKDVGYKTSETIWNLKIKPKILVILGGGPVACEMAQAFGRLGIEVILVNQKKNLLPKEDNDVSDEISKSFLKDGVKILNLHEAVSINRIQERKFILLSGPEGNVEFEFDEILIAIGRIANTKIPGLDKLCLELNENGTFSHNKYLRTKYPNIYVCGDCAGPFQFSHMAAHQAWYASVNALFGSLKLFVVDYRVVPWTTFTDPEVARVGLSESEAKAQGIEYDLTKYGLDELDRAIADDDAYGFVKVLTTKGSDKILGAAVVSAHGSDILAQIVLAMKWGIGMNKILGTIHTYPTFSESVKYTAGLWKKKHSPEIILRLLEKFHTWRRN
jgi:pyruvate/2-oxoglutarate dehydrogenase complex dihydrolipoamide dehydrogenase (E3) component/uncharacterized membrane protein YdjX (TVP38/TMEM64 family)